MSEGVDLKKIITHPIVSLGIFLSVCCILPIYGGSAVTIVSCAGVMSAYVWVLPEQFRSRSGSMTAATCLVTAIWIGAAVVTVLTLMGEIRS